MLPRLIEVKCTYDADSKLTESTLFFFISPVAKDAEGDPVEIILDGISNSDFLTVVINKNNSFSILVDRTKVSKD